MIVKNTLYITYLRVVSSSLTIGYILDA